MSPEMQQHAFSARYLGEVVLALREVGEDMPAVEDMLTYASFCNSNFTMTVIKFIMVCRLRFSLDVLCIKYS